MILLLLKGGEESSEREKRGKCLGSAGVSCPLSWVLVAEALTARRTREGRTPFIFSCAARGGGGRGAGGGGGGWAGVGRAG